MTQQNKQAFRHIIWNLLAKWLKKLALSSLGKLLGASLTGVWGWLAGMAISKVLKEVVKPVVLGAFRKTRAFFKGKKTKKITKEIKNADSESDFDDAVDDL